MDGDGKIVEIAISVVLIVAWKLAGFAPTSARHQAQIAILTRMSHSAPFLRKVNG